MRAYFLAMEMYRGEDLPARDRGIRIASESTHGFCYAYYVVLVRALDLAAVRFFLVHEAGKKSAAV